MDVEIKFVRKLARVVSLETGSTLWEGDYIGALEACREHDWNLIE